MLLMAMTQMVASNPAVNVNQPKEVEFASQNGAMSLEESFLHVPAMCKDRSFPFVPVKAEREVISQDVLSLYGSMDQIHA